MTCLDCEPSPWWHVFDSTAYLTRDHCGDWPAWLVWAWAVPSLAIFALYMGIAGSKVRLYRRMRGTAHPRWASLSVAAFFVGCAGGHLANALAFRWPAYRLFVLWDWYTLAASAVGFFAIRRLLDWQVAEHGAARTAERLAAETAATLDAAERKAERYRIALTQAETRIILMAAGAPGGAA